MKKNIKKFFGLTLGTGGIYVFFLVFPNLLFAKTYQYKNFEIYSDCPITKNIESVLDDAILRLEESELYTGEDKFSVYLCNKNWRFKFFTRNGNAGGVVNFPISSNIFIRACNIEKNEIIPPGGWMYTPKERPLSYYIAHEAIHSLQRKISPFLQLTTPSYILEGYADYIAKKPNFDYERYKELFLKNDYVMNPKNGLYHRYHLYTSYLIDINAYSFEKIIEEQPDLEITLKEATKK